MADLTLSSMEVSGLKRRIKGNAEKTEFRKSKEWKLFRKQILQERGPQCECCLKKTRAVQLHHIDPANYTVLDPHMFALVCRSCHSCISDLEKMKPENRLKLRAEWYVKAYGKFIKN